jgi:hypothetical protein
MPALGPSKLPETLLYLFSSNLQPLYLRNVLSFLAAPAGLRYTLRYDATWVNDAARRQWPHDGLRGVRALLHFALQHPSQYADPTFVPVRRAEVVGSSVQGSIYFVTVAMCGELSLTEPPPPESLPDWQRRHPESVVLRRYRSVLNSTLNAPIPYEFSAGLLTRPGHLAVLEDVIDFDLEPADALRRNARYLAKVESFADASFVRLLAVRELTSGRVVPLSSTDAQDRAGPRYDLDGGTVYQLEFFNYNPQPVTHPKTFQFTTSEDVVTFPGWGGFEIASRYDQPVVTMKTARPTSGSTLEAVLALRPLETSGGANLDLPIRVRTRRGRVIAEVVASTMVVVLLGLAAAAQGAIRWYLGAAGVLLAASLQFAGWVVPGITTAAQAAWRGSPATPPPPPGTTGAHH